MNLLLSLDMSTMVGRYLKASIIENGVKETIMSDKIIIYIKKYKES